MARILIAEDDPIMFRMYERAFKLAGHELIIAVDGEEAMHAIQTLDPAPAIVLLDIMMPKKNGFEVLRDMKADPRLARIPAVILSNLAGQKDIDTGIALGAAAYLIKSQYGPRQVIEQVENILKQAS